MHYILAASLLVNTKYWLCLPSPSADWLADIKSEDVPQMVTDERGYEQLILLTGASMNTLFTESCI